MTTEEINIKEMNPGEKPGRKHLRSAKEEAEERNAVLIAYLHKKLQIGKRYFISRDIAEETGISTRRIGRFMHEYSTDKTGFVIEPWGGGNRTVWKITLSPEQKSGNILLEMNLQPCEIKTSEV